MTKCPRNAKYVARFNTEQGRWEEPPDEYIGKPYSVFAIGSKWATHFTRCFEHDGQVYVVDGVTCAVKVYADLDTAKIAMELKS